MASAQTDDDYAADPVPEDKRIAWPLIFFAEMGVATSLFFMQMTSILVLNYGSKAALSAIVYATVIASAVGFGVCRIAIKTGFGTNVMARRVLGFRGASLFSIIFTINGFVYFAAEAVIMGMSLRTFLPNLALWVVLPLIALGMIPLIWFGMRLLARLQLATFFLYAVLLLWAVYVSLMAPSGGREWLHFVPEHHPSLLTGLLAGMGTMNSVVFISGILSADYNRFARRSDLRTASLITGIGFQVCCFAMSGLFGVWFGVRYMESNPGAYFVTMIGGWGTLFAIATQLRINLSNMYGGSLAALNVLKQVADIDVSRHLVVAVFGVAAAVALMFDWLSNLTLALNLIGMFTTCFTCLVLVDFYLVRPLTHEEETGGGAAHANLPDWRWQAMLALIIATAIGSLLETKMFGGTLAWLAGPIAAICETAVYLVACRLSVSELALARS